MGKAKQIEAKREQTALKVSAYTYSDFPVCPYCGHLERDAWEIDFGPGLDGNTHTWCGSCGKEYFLSRNVSVSYSSKKI